MVFFLPSYLVILVVVVSTDGQPTIQQCDGPGGTCSWHELQENVIQLKNVVRRMEDIQAEQASKINQLAENNRQTQSALSKLTDEVRQVQATQADHDNKINLLTEYEQNRGAPLLNSSITNIPNSAFTASSYLSSSYHPACARIHIPRDPRSGCDSTFRWLPSTGANPTTSWWQVELSKTDIYQVSATETQGYGTYISQYTISYITTSELKSYLDKTGKSKVFTATSRFRTSQVLYPQIKARTIRIQIVACAPATQWNYCDLRVELYGVKQWT